MVQRSAREPTGTDSVTRRRGRPPATDSADTRRKIFDVARILFAERGYGAVTNKDVASAAGITTGALYHYVESKLDLYVQVDSDVRRAISERFRAAAATEDTFRAQLSAVLEAAYEISEDDPAVASFVGAVRTDMRRHPDVADRLVSTTRALDRFIDDLVGVGVATGEIPEGAAPLVSAFIRAVLIGIAELTSDPRSDPRDAIDGVQLLLAGSLLRAATAVD